METTIKLIYVLVIITMVVGISLKLKILSDIKKKKK